MISVKEEKTIVKLKKSYGKAGNLQSDGDTRIEQ